MTHRIFKPWYQLDFVYKMTKMYPEQKKCSKITYGFVGDIINNKKRSFNVSQAQEAASALNDGSFKTPQIFIDQLLKLEGAHFNDWDMLSEASTIVAAVSLVTGEMDGSIVDGRKWHLHPLSAHFRDTRRPL